MYKQDHVIFIKAGGGLQTLVANIQINPGVSTGHHELLHDDLFVCGDRYFGAICTGLRCATG